MGTIGPDPEGNKEKVEHPAAADGVFPDGIEAWTEREWRTLAPEDRARLAGEPRGEERGHSSRHSPGTGSERESDATPFPGLEFDSVHEGMSARTLLLPGEAMVPEERWVPQHRRALQRCGRGRANQLSVWRVEKAGALIAVREERVDGCDLGRLLAGEGALPWATALAILRRVDWALDHLEGKGGAFPVWWLPADAIQLVTGSRDREESLRRTGLEKPEVWEHLPLRLRLHQRARSLERGGETLPESLLKLCVGEEREHPRARRTGVLLPLAWRLCTGEKFSWEKPLDGKEGNDLASETREWLESVRRELVEDPTGVEHEFLAGLEKTLGTPSPSLAPADDKPLGAPASPPAPANDQPLGAPSPSLASADDRTQEQAQEIEKEKDNDKEKEKESHQKEQPDSEAEHRGASPSGFRWMLPVVAGVILASLFALLAFELPKPHPAGAEGDQPSGPQSPREPLASYESERERIPAEMEWLLRARPGRTVEELARLAEQDDPEALRVLGLAALHGRWISRDREGGHAWLRRAAALGDTDAMAVLAERWLAGDRSGLGEDAETKASLYLRRAARQGDARARRLLEEFDPPDD